MIVAFVINVLRHEIYGPILIWSMQWTEPGPELKWVQTLDLYLSFSSQFLWVLGAHFHLYMT